MMLSRLSPGAKGQFDIVSAAVVGKEISWLALLSSNLLPLLVLA
jgi:hypothetical protein